MSVTCNVTGQFLRQTKQSFSSAVQLLELCDLGTASKGSAHNYILDFPKTEQQSN